MSKYCVIMAGGIGSRFWPLSQKSKPKQFVDILSTGSSMLRRTYKRFLPIVPKENIIILTNIIYKEMVMEEIPELDESQILCEPIRRNTAACIAYAAYHISSLDKNATMIVAPSDHYIRNKSKFKEAVDDCFQIAESQDILMTIGIKPNKPETGYGYIQSGENVDKSIFKVKSFIEKPNLEMAQVFLDTEEFLWNSGMFVWSCKSIISAFHLHKPSISSVFEEGLEYFNTPEEQRFVDQVFPKCEKISIDYAIMEKAKNAYVYESDFVWSDIGTWGALYEHSEEDENKNVITGCKAVLRDTKGCIIKTDTYKNVVVDGLENYIIVESKDGLLVCPFDNEQKIRTYISEFNDK